MSTSVAPETERKDESTEESPELNNTLESAVRVLKERPEWKGVFGWNDFDSSIVYLRDPPIAGVATGDRLMPINDALAPLGVTVTKLPATPSAIVELIEHAQRED